MHGPISGGLAKHQLFGGQQKGKFRFRPISGRRRCLKQLTFKFSMYRCRSQYLFTHSHRTSLYSTSHHAHLFTFIFAMPNGRRRCCGSVNFAEPEQPMVSTHRPRSVHTARASPPATDSQPLASLRLNTAHRFASSTILILDSIRSPCLLQKAGRAQTIDKQSSGRNR